MTAQPTNESELQLYRVLQRANLLSYYDTFIGQGGDDVQQLCEAGEEEFLEIMALVGMASKPLHVRRLQKALQEWVNNPAMFQTPLMPSIPPVPHAVPVGRPVNLTQQPPPPPPPQQQHQPPPPPIPHSQHNHLPPTRPSPPIPIQLPNNHSPSPSITKEPAPSPNSQLGPLSMTQMANGAASEKDKQECPPYYLYYKGTDHNSGDYGQPGSPLQLTPVLVESQIQRLAEAAEMLVKSLPPFEPKPQNSKKKICKELEYVISMSDDDPRRMDEIRKFAAIYGRFDCKRKPEKPLTLHEVSVNEAAAQICRHIPALLTRRDELFPLARQVVRDSGYQYSKGHSNWGDSSRSQNFNPRHFNSCDEPGGKRSRLDQDSPDSNSKHGTDIGRMKRQERLEMIGEDLKQLSLQQEELRVKLTQARDAQDFPIAQQIQQQLEQLNAQQVQYMAEQSELVKRQRHSRYYSSKGNGRMSSCSDPERPDTDDTDSQYSFSNTSSPSQDVHDSSSQDFTLQSQATGDLKVQMQVQDMFPLKGSNKKSNAHITKQMMQETLMDEGLRVVKELSSQIKEEPDILTTNSNVPMSLSVSPAGGGNGSSGDGLTGSIGGHHHHHQHHHHQHQAQTHPHHHSPSSQSQIHQSMQSYRYPPCTLAVAPPNVNIGNNNVGLGNSGCCTPNGTSSSSPIIGRGDRDCRPPSSNGQGPENHSNSNSSDVEKAAASTINALLSLSQNAGRGMKHEYPSPSSTCPKAD
ncbi:hypothetical protein CHUAL_010334 [Chamberlinius hualienensis]